MGYVSSRRRIMSAATITSAVKTPKNLIDPSKFFATEENGIYTYNRGGYYANLFTGQNGSSHIVNDLSKLPILDAGSYVWSYKYFSGSPITRIESVDDNGDRTRLEVTQLETDGDYRSCAFTLTARTRICIIRANNTNPCIFSEPQLELGTVRTTYEPYQGGNINAN